MISIIIYLALLFTVGAVYSIIQYRYGVKYVTVSQMIMYILASRIFPFLMYQEKSFFLAGLMLWDMVMLCIIVTIIKRLDKESARGRLFIIVTMLNPVMPLCLISGDKTALMTGILSVAFILIVMYGYIIRKINNVIYPVLGMLGLISGIYGICINRVYTRQSWRAITASGGEAPVLLIVSAFTALLSWLYLIYDFACSGKKNTSVRCPHIMSAASVDNNADRRADRYDFIIILTMMLLYGAASIWKLGSFDMPQSSYLMDENNRDIILDLGETKNIKSISVFLDYKSNQKLSFSVLDNATGKWKVIESNKELDSVFQWNDIPVNENTGYIGIVCMDSWELLDEIVILDNDDNIVMPVNSNEYSNLFDEQQLYHSPNTYYYETMFDEVYHVRTAYEFIKGYEIYENTHPPLGKVIISLGIRIFGKNPFGFRFMSFLAGLLCIPFIYLFGMHLTGKREGGILAGILICTEFMHFVLSRIGTLDIFVALFIVATFYYMFRYIQTVEQSGNRRKQYAFLLLSGISAGTAIATKWTGVYAGVGICVLFFISFFEQYKLNKKNKQSKSIISLALWCILSFIIIPLGIYTLSYIPFARVYGGSLVSNAISNSRLMLSYHSVTVFEHPYSSEWYEWIWDKQPLLDACDAVGADKVSSVATFGNPLIVVGGLLALIYVGYLWRCKKDKNAGILIIMYLANLLPWLLVHRTVFIYHYYPCILILVLIVTYAIVKVSRGKKMYTIGAIITSLVLFALYYTELTGIPVSRDYINNILELLSTWRFA